MHGALAHMLAGMRASPRRLGLCFGPLLLSLFLVASPPVHAEEGASQPPRVRQVTLSATSWSQKFVRHLQKTRKGRGGYALRSEKQLLTPMAWQVNRISIRFTDDVRVVQEDLTVSTTELDSLGIKSFEYDERTFTATWTLEKRIRSGGLLLSLSDSVTSSSDGQRLDGEFLGKLSTGDREAGGELMMPFTVLRGDVDGDGSITEEDVSRIASRIAEPPVSIGDPLYDARADTNADGKISPADLGYVQRNIGAAVFPSDEGGDSPRGGKNGKRRKGPRGGDRGGRPGNPSLGSDPGGRRGSPTPRPGDGGAIVLPSIPSGDIVPGRLIVKIADGARAARRASALREGRSFEELNAIHGLERMKSLVGNRPVTAESAVRSARLAAESAEDRMANTYVLEFDRRSDVEQLARLYSKSPDVEYAEPDRYLRVSLTPNDPSYSSLWAMPKIQANVAWDQTQGQNVVVAVIDTGVLYTHPDLASNMWSNPNEIPNNGRDDDGNGYVDDVRGWDFVNNDNDPVDDHSHGSHCAGTIAAVGNNGVGVIGVAYRARIMPLKVLSASGSGSLSAIASAIRYAASNGAHVTSNSYGGAGFSQALNDAFAFAKSRNVVNIVAAGNDNADASGFTPANAPFPDVVTVAASTQSDTRASFSNYGTSVEVAAPGVGILSTVLNNGYATYQGTSMATPHVAGVAALYLSLNPGSAMSAVANRLISTGVTPGSSNIGKRVNALAMVQQPAPSITGFSPTSGSPGAQITISGSNLGGASQVTFNGTGAAFTVASQSSITATVPAGATSGQIRVTTPAGTATSSASFTVTPPPPAPPSVSGFSPGSGAVGSQVTISGSNFTGATQVTFNGRAATFTVVSAASISATVPAGATNGPIGVTTPGGSASSSASFMVIDPTPRITGFAPNGGVVGSTFTITGEHLDSATAVLLNGRGAMFMVNANQSLSVIVPWGATSGRITVTTPNGSATSSSNFTVTAAGPSLSSGDIVVGPDEDRAGLVRVFARGSASPRFELIPYDPSFGGGVRVASGDVNGDGVPDLVTGAGPGGGPHVMVFDGVNGAVLGSFMAFDAAFSGGVFVAAGDLDGNGRAEIVAGSGDSGVARVKVFDGTTMALLRERTMSSGSFTRGVRVSVGDTDGDGLYDIIAGSGAGAASAVEVYRGSNLGFLGAFSPYGSFTGGVYVAAYDMDGDGRDDIVTGPGSGMAPNVRIFTPAGFSRIGAFDAYDPSFQGGVRVGAADFGGSPGLDLLHGAGTNGGPHVIARDGADLSTELVGFMAYQGSGGVFVAGARPATVGPPRITGFTPTHGAIGTQVEIRGEGFAGMSQILFNGVSAQIVSRSGSSIGVRVPNGATTGKISLTGSRGNCESASDFRVTTPPVITRFSPSQGTENTLVTITGSGFAADAVPYFNGTPANFYSIESDGTILARVPRGATEGPITVTTSGGSAVSTGNYVVIPPPRITSFSPTSGPIGTEVRLLGSGFTRVHSVGIGNGSTSEFTIVSDTEIVLRVPANATTGRAAVAIPEGTSRSSGLFTVE